MKNIIIIPFLFFSCKKVNNQPKLMAPTVTVCNNWQGVWWPVDGNSVVNDSLVIVFDKMVNDTVYYKSNYPFFDGCIKHVCPYRQKNDDITITKKNKNYTFRYSH